MAELANLANLNMVTLRLLRAENVYGLASPGNPHADDEFVAEAMEIAWRVLRGAHNADDAADIVADVFRTYFDERALDTLAAARLGELVWSEITEYRAR